MFGGNVFLLPAESMIGAVRDSVADKRHDLPFRFQTNHTCSKQYGSQNMQFFVERRLKQELGACRT